MSVVPDSGIPPDAEFEDERLKDPKNRTLTRFIWETIGGILKGIVILIPICVLGPIWVHTHYKNKGDDFLFPVGLFSTIPYMLFWVGVCVIFFNIKPDNIILILNAVFAMILHFVISGYKDWKYRYVQ